MTPAQLALLRGQAQLVDRLAQLEARLAAGEDVWTLYAEALRTLAAVAPLTTPEARGALLTTRELAERLRISTRTVRRRMQAQQLEPVRLGKRGRAALRWPAAAGR